MQRSACCAGSFIPASLVSLVSDQSVTVCARVISFLHLLEFRSEHAVNVMHAISAHDAL